MSPLVSHYHMMVTRALVHDDSFFTPGKPIWTKGNLDNLHDRLVAPIAIGEQHLFLALANRLGINDADDAIVQLMSEVLYWHVLPMNERTVNGTTKRSLIGMVLDLCSTPVDLPFEWGGHP